MDQTPERPGLGRVHIDLDLTEETLARVDQIGADAQMTRAEVLQALIEAALRVSPRRDDPPGPTPRSTTSYGGSSDE